MNKFYKIIEIGYIIVFVVFVYEGITNFNTDRTKSYILFLFAGLALFSYFFKKKFRKRFQERRNNKEQ